jgi:hypothetical protein
MEPTQPPIQWMPEAPSSGGKAAGHEADHSPPTNAEVKLRGSIHPLPHTSSSRSTYLVKQKGQLYYEKVSILDLRFSHSCGYD